MFTCEPLSFMSAFKADAIIIGSTESLINNNIICSPATN
jgi:hypothetical protein